MAIVVPKIGDIVDATTFGAPVANELNRISPLVIAGSTFADAVGNGGNINPGGVLATITIPSAPYVRKLLGWYHALISYTAGVDVQIQIDGAQQIGYRTPGGILSITADIMSPVVSLSANTAHTFRAISSSGNTVPITMYADPTFNRICYMTFAE